MIIGTTTTAMLTTTIAGIERAVENTVGTTMITGNPTITDKNVCAIINADPNTGPIQITKAITAITTATVTGRILRF